MPAKEVGYGTQCAGGRVPGVRVEIMLRVQKDAIRAAWRERRHNPIFTEYYGRSS